MRFKVSAGLAAAARPFLALAAIVIAVAGCGTGDLIRVADMGVVEPPALSGELRGADIIFVGEHHDDRLHHRKQLMVIRSLHESGVDVAVGLEMYLAQNQEQLDRWVAGTVPEREMKKLFARNWGIPWSKYREIFRYARDEGIPLVGLNISKKVIHQIFKEGFGSLTPEQLSVMPGARCDVDEKYEEFIRMAMGEHDHGGHGKEGAARKAEDGDEEPGSGAAAGPDEEVSAIAGEATGAGGADEEGLSGSGDATGAGGPDEESGEDAIFRKFCEAQAAWDATMAFRAVEYLDENPGRTLVVLAGSAHSWKRGIPRLVRARSDYHIRVIIPESSEHLSIRDITLDDADYLWLDPW